MHTWNPGPNAGPTQPMRIQVAPNSRAAKKYYATIALPGRPWPMPEAIAPGISAAPLDDLIFHGGKTVGQMQFQNVLVGSTNDWADSDATNIDAAIAAAMNDAALNNVMIQYFPGVSSLLCAHRPMMVQGVPKPAKLDEPDVQGIVKDLFAQGKIPNQDLDSTIFNLLLPRGTILALGDANSQEGLGGYHGSVHVTQGGKSVTLYYSANVFSEGQNGIPAFDTPWKNVVGTLYHEMNEFRTDADVNDAIQRRDNDFLGWMSRQGEECGDQPIVAAGSHLERIFQQVAAPGGKTFVQFMYSNSVHGAEGPIDRPH